MCGDSSDKGAVICSANIRARKGRFYRSSSPLDSPWLLDAHAPSKGELPPLALRATPDQRRACLPPHGLPSIRSFATRYPRPTVMSRLDTARVCLPGDRQRTRKEQCSVHGATVRRSCHVWRLHLRLALQLQPHACVSATHFWRGACLQIEADFSAGRGRHGLHFLHIHGKAIDVFHQHFDD